MNIRASILIIWWVFFIAMLTSSSLIASNNNKELSTTKYHKIDSLLDSKLFDPKEVLFEVADSIISLYPDTDEVQYLVSFYKGREAFFLGKDSLSIVHFKNASKAAVRAQMWMEECKSLFKSRDWVEYCYAT